MALLGTFTLVMVIILTGTSTLKKTNELLDDKLMDLMRQYQWTIEKSGRKNDATITWDAFQSLECCGVRGPKDWEEFRPESLDYSAHPASCCGLTRISGKSDNYCTKKDPLNQDGCMDRIVMIEVIMIMVLSFDVLFQYLMAFMAAVLICCTDDHESIDPEQRRSQWRRSDPGIVLSR